jgi:hypothetical protein
MFRIFGIVSLQCSRPTQIISMALRLNQSNRTLSPKIGRTNTTYPVYFVLFYFSPFPTFLYYCRAKTQKGSVYIHVTQSQKLKSLTIFHYIERYLGE